MCSHEVLPLVYVIIDYHTISKWLVFSLFMSFFNHWTYNDFFPLYG
jgi:hypothetical protein